MITTLANVAYPALLWQLRLIASPIIRWSLQLAYDSSSAEIQTQKYKYKKNNAKMQISDDHCNLHTPPLLLLHTYISFGQFWKCRAIWILLLSKAINAPQMRQTTFSWLKHQACVNLHRCLCDPQYCVVTIRRVAKIIIKLRGESGLNLQLTLLSWAVHPINAAINTEQALLKCSIINYSRWLDKTSQFTTLSHFRHLV